MPNAFYINPNNLNGEFFTLDKNESYHASKVFRLKPGDPISLLNGEGLAYEAVIEKYKSNIIFGRIEKKIYSLGENKININVFPAILKRDRFEILLEKVTEMGVVDIYPILTDRCIKRQINLERCKKIITSSAKQCQRSFFPIIHKPKNLKSFFNNPISQSFAGIMRSSKKISDIKFNKSKSVNVFIGPEGDFSFDEVQLMEKSGVNFFSLGNRRLRSETAIQASLAIFNELLE
ncbi:MAG: RsmE family RNA methyltransferase [Candidatus Neomarinimicrobiota bacterium]